jgi:hypothetical protein
MLRQIWKDACKEMDCGDSGCIFKIKNEFGVYGMRTNGGCQCQKQMPARIRLPLTRLLRRVRALAKSEAAP